MINHPLSFISLFVAFALTITNIIGMTTFSKIFPTIFLAAAPMLYMLECVIISALSKPLSLEEVLRNKRQNEEDDRILRNRHNNSPLRKYDSAMGMFALSAIMFIAYHYSEAEGFVISGFFALLLAMIDFFDSI